MHDKRAWLDFSRLCCEDRTGIETVRRWIVEYLENHPEVGLIVLVAHYGCEAAGGSTLEESELRMSKEVKAMRAILREHSWHPNPVVLGCLYDKDFDWLAIYDEDTEMFLPANVHLPDGASA